MKKIYPVSLGCPKNKADFEKLLAIFKKKGYQIVLSPEEADEFWINTCAFIRPAVEESLEYIFELGKIKKPHQKLIVSGCLPERYKNNNLKELLPEVDKFIGIEPYKIFTSQEPVERILTESPFYAYLKIAEGCNNNCTYCTIPKIRGRYKSKPLELLIKETKYLAKLGIKEIILVAQDVTFYGYDKGKKDALLRLIENISKIEEIKRIRLLYLHPQRVTKDLIKNLLSFSKLVPYFDIPIQHSDSRILKLMNRHYDSEKILDIISYIRELNPFSAIRTTIIVGFPGEEEKEFLSLLEFLKIAKFDYLGVFIYYAEEGTPAEKMNPKISYKEKIKRKREIRKLQKTITKKQLQMRVGTEEEVLILGEDLRGRLWGIAKIQAPEIDGISYIISKKSDMQPLYPGDVIKIKIKKSGVYDLWGEPIF
ncbi:30S ribosomal protein S12 methylthiotransferase RimO [Candidatus Pacearchaeota archaeon]|nr:MAG: 30S ribosomal protein S12 methylthiotransferase RimO [Candidatus Pacearchaeota archaeon]